MDFLNVAYLSVGIIGVPLTIIGYSHAILTKKIEKLSLEMQTRRTDADIRVLISDKIEPFKSEIKWLTQQIEALSSHFVDLDRKLDNIQNSLTILSTKNETLNRKL